MVSNEKIVNYKIVYVFEIYNFCLVAFPFENLKYHYTLTYDYATFGIDFYEILRIK
jgi:hypothetical protein